MKIDLFNGDALKVMDELIRNGIKVDSIITSPPYNLGNHHHTGNKTHYPYQDNMDEVEYQKWQLEFLDKCYNILKDDGSIFYNHKNRIKKGVQIVPYEWILKSRLVVKQELVWQNGSQNFDKIRFYPTTERIYWLVKNPSTKIYNTINHHDIFTKKDWNSVGTNGIHQRAFPIKMVKDLISCLINPDTILDPFMGSGTTGVACKNLDLNFIGIELSKKYYDIAKKRITEAQSPLFALQQMGGIRQCMR